MFYEDNYETFDRIIEEMLVDRYLNHARKVVREDSIRARFNQEYFDLLDRAKARGYVLTYHDDLDEGYDPEYALFEKDEEA